MTNKFRMLLLFMAAVGIVGCADKLTDDVVQSPDDIGGENGYISFRIKSADTGGLTRAWNDDDTYYHPGDPTEIGTDLLADENAIVGNIQANRVFFFKNDKYHSSSFLNLTKKAEGEGGHTGDEVHKDDGYSDKESVYSATVKRTSDRGEQDWPDECLVILNGRPSRLNALLARAQADPDFNKKQFLEWVNKDADDDKNGANDGFTLGLYQYEKGEGTNADKYMYYFTMTNSVFFDQDKTTVTDGDGTSTKENVVINATKIDVEKQLFATSDEAAKNPVTVYVERIMSKVEVEFKGKNKDGENIDVTEMAYTDGENTLKGYLYTFTDDHETDSKWFEKGESKKMQVLVTNWTINAIEYQTRLFKMIDKDWVSEDTESDKPFKGWNDYNHHRSYWAIDGHYNWNPNEYPTQYRKVYPERQNSTDKSYEDNRVEYPNKKGWVYGEKTKEEGNDATKTGYPWALDYKSFNTIKSNSQYKYCLENTFECEQSTPGNSYVYQNMIMGSHLLVQARLLTGDEITNGVDLSKIGDKYYYSDRYYDEENYIKRQLAVINEVLSENVGSLYADNVNMWDDKDEILSKAEGHTNQYHFDNIAGGLWIKEGEIYKKVVVEVEEDMKESQILATEVFNIAPAYVEKGDGKVTIALKDRSANPTGSDDCAAGYGYTEQNVNLYYFPYAGIDKDGQPLKKVMVKKDGKEEEEEEEEEKDNDPVQFTRNQLVSLIYRATNIADCFKEGMMYYAVPVQHFNAGKDEKGDDSDGNYVYKYDNVKTGDYGIVRNHWYKFTINAIAKPGVPVHDPDQPIIPNYDNEDRYIGFEVVILPWHIVNNGNVTLGQ